MGPRSHERGNRAFSSRIQRPNPSRFNGAAFSRTRKRIGSNRRPIPYGALQWGRVLTNAETGCRCSDPHAIDPLQWGRVLTNAETPRRRLWAGYSRSLQWGRVLTNAETRAEKEGPEAVAKVLQWGRVLTNAETSLVRERYAKGCLLQWGRVLTNAETHCDGMVRNYAHDASMGPRSHERGNSPIRRCRGSRRTRFNGAAFSRTRKLPGLGCGFDQGFVASMGPRSHERGNAIAVPWPRGASLARFNGAAFSRTRKRSKRSTLRCCAGFSFNGAAFSRTRKRGRRSCPLCPSRASMGPRSHERGNTAGAKAWILSSSMLQWGRVLTNAETH